LTNKLKTPNTDTQTNTIEAPTNHEEVPSVLPIASSTEQSTQTSPPEKLQPKQSSAASWFTSIKNSMKKDAKLSFDVDLLIARLLDTKPGKKCDLLESEIKSLCVKSREILLSQPTLLELDFPLTIGGDLHGQFHDLVRFFKKGGYPETTNYLFLGDYVDRGKYGIETICLLLAYKVKYPDNFFLLRGNHESESINRVYGFYDECKRCYSVKLWKCFTQTFNCFPLAAVIADQIFLCSWRTFPRTRKIRSA